MTPILADVWEKEQDRFEVIWVTQDGTRDAADDYYNKSMPWVRMTYDDANSIGWDLFKAVEQKYIPSLTMLDPDMNSINKNARWQIFGGKDLPWKQ